MKKIISLALFSILLFANQVNTEDSNITVEDTNLSALSEDELMAELMRVDKELEERKANIKNLEKLEKTVDELSEHLNINE